MLADTRGLEANRVTLVAFRILSAVCRAMLAAPILHHLAWRIMPTVRRLFSQDIEMRTTFADGVQFLAILSDHIESQIFWQGVQEADRDELALVLELIEPGQVFFDVGANVGTFTLPVAPRLGEGEVHAFEPWQPHLIRLHRNIELNGYRNIVVNDCALGQTDGKVTLNVPAGNNTGMASIYPGEMSAALKAEVRCTTLDAYVAARRLHRLDLIKIDVEGAELDVLEGGTSVLTRFRPKLVIELAAANLHRGGRAYRDVFEFFGHLEYRVFKIGRNCGLLPVRSLDDLRPEQNVYCVPSSSG